VSTHLAQRISEELLDRVRQPAQYIGGEVNQLVRPGDWHRADVRVAVAFPDTYAIGMSYLGGQILYGLCNHTEGVCAERVYCPWTDAEQVMRSRGIPLFTWDTRQPVCQADFLAVSLQHELCDAGVLTLLDLAGIPLRRGDRGESHPIVLAGGPVADNPEPLADFVDLFVIGDGEESLPALLTAYRRLRKDGACRDEIVVELARRFEWVYAPGAYAVSYHPDGRIAGVEPTVPGLHHRVARCVVSDLEGAPVPERPLVPYAEIVHDRISIEIMRGCPHLCRFCHAGHTKRPVRIRSVDRICRIAEAAYRNTGHEEIGLLSLSTADYPYLTDLARRLAVQFADRNVNLSVPSLRVDQMLSDIPSLIRGVRKGGLTMAVEASSNRLRRLIGKPITDENLLAGVRAAYEAGWRSVKLYFMVGFPGEQDQDIEGIWHLARRISDLRRQVAGSPAAVNATVSWLVPKPHTCLQWAAQPRKEYFLEVRKRLTHLSGRARSGVKWKFHRVERSVLEAVLARGDRRLGRVIERAWRAGARFDAWDDQFDARRWDQAFDSEGIDPAFYAHRARGYDEVLPWDHIDGCLRREHLWRGYERVLVAATEREHSEG